MATALAAVALFALLAAPAGASLKRSYESSFGSFSGESPQAITVDQSNGDVYVLSTFNNKLMRFDSSGSPKNFTAGPDAGTNALTVNVQNIRSFSQVAIDNSGGPSDGNIYVVQSFSGQVSVFAPSGEPLGGLSGSGTPAGTFGESCGIAVDQSNGDVYVASWENRVWRYSPSGSLVVEADYSGGIATTINPCQLAVGGGSLYAHNWQESPSVGFGPLRKYATADFATGAPPSPASTQLVAKAGAVATDPSNGDVYVDEGNRVSVFNSSGSPIYSFGEGDFGTSSTGVAVRAGGNAYVSDPVAHQVDIYSTTLEPGDRASLFSFGSFSGESPQALTVDQSNGDVYVLSPSTNKLLRFNSSGLPKNFTAGPDAGTNALSVSVQNLRSFSQVAIDNSGGPSDGNIYVVQSFSGQVSVFAPSGESLGGLSGSGTPAGTFGESCGIAVDQSNGDVYVASWENRIWRYSPSGSLVAEADYSGGIATTINPCQLAVGGGSLYAHSWQESPSVGFGPLRKYATTDFATGAPPSPASTQIADKAGAVATDPSNGDVYVDEGNRVSVFSSSGSPIYSFGEGDFGTSSAGVAVRAGGGNAYVSDPVGHQVDVYGPFSAPPPTVETGQASNVKHTKATLNGHLDPNDSLPITDCEFEWGTDTAYSETPVPCAEGSSFDSPADVSAELTGLTPGTTYHFRLHVATSADDYEGEDESFETVPPSSTPEVLTGSGTALSPSSASLAGSVNPNANPLTDCRFEYVTDVVFWSTGFTDLSSGGSVPCTPAFGSIPADFEDHAVTATVSGLDPDAIYRFRLVAENTNGAGAGQGAFIPGAPLVETVGSPTRTATTARLDSRINPHGRQTSYHFEYVSDEQFQGSGFDNAQSTQSTPLEINEVQRWMMCGSGSFTFTFKGDVTTGISTQPSAKEIQTALEALPSIGSGNVAVDGPAIHNVSLFYITFQGSLANSDVPELIDTYSSPGTCAASMSTVRQGAPGVEQSLVSTHLQGLTPGTTYHYRLLADSGLPGGTATGEEMTLTTRTSDNPLSHGGDVAGPPGSDRGWELVSPGDSSGNPVNGPTAISSDGNRAIIRMSGGSPDTDVGTFGTQLFMERTSSGWRPVPFYPSRAEAVGGQWTPPSGRDDLGATIAENFDPGKDRTFWRLSPSGSPEHVFTTTSEEYGNSFYASDDGSRVLAILRGSQDPDVPVADSALNLYDVSTGTPEMASFLPGDVVPACGVSGGIGGPSGFEMPATTQTSRQFRWVTPDGSEAYFLSKGSACGGAVDLYARNFDTGVTTLLSPGSGSNVVFIRSTPGSVFFGMDGDVYRFDLAEEALECVTCVVDGVPANVGVDRGFPAVSEDGSHVYFQSGARLVDGAPNTAIYEVEVDSGELSYVAGGDSAFGGIGIRAWSGSEMNGDGSVLVFRSPEPHLDLLNGPTNGGTWQYYRFDADDRSLVCISCPLDGTAPRADVSERLVETQQMGPNLGAVSNDGTVVFPTPTPLIGADQNTANPAQSPVAGQDVYEWRDGAVHLVSDGLRASAGDINVPDFAPSVGGITPDARSIFFRASAQLTPDAIDAYTRIYSARIGGGFEFPEATPPCSLDACQGTPRGTPEEPRPGSLDLAGAGNPAPPPTRCRKGKVRRKGRCVATRKRQRARKHKAQKRKQQRAAHDNRRTAR